MPRHSLADRKTYAIIQRYPACFKRLFPRVNSGASPRSGRREGAKVFFIYGDKAYYLFADFANKSIARQIQKGGIKVVLFSLPLARDHRLS
jgi:hypothetical protein